MDASLRDLLLFCIKYAAFQCAAGSENVFAGIQRIHAAALCYCAQLNGTLFIAVKFDTHDTSSTGSGCQLYGIIQTGLYGNPGCQNGAFTVTEIVEDFAPHGHHITQDAPDAIRRQEKTDIQYWLQQNAATILQAVLDSHRGGNDEVQWVGMVLVITAIHQRDGNVGYLSA